MDIARINCAHDDIHAWARMAALVRQEGASLGQRPLVSFDLAGPKLRTGPIRPGPAVVRWSPSRDDFGRIDKPARVLLYEAGSSLRAAATPGTPVLPLERGEDAASFFAEAQPGFVISFLDSAGRRRSLTVDQRIEGPGGAALLCSAVHTAYIIEGTKLALFSGTPAATKKGGRHAHESEHASSDDSKGERVTAARVAALPPAAGFLSLATGDIVRVESGSHAGYAIVDEERLPGGPVAVLTVDVPEVFASVRWGRSQVGGTPSPMASSTHHSAPHWHL